MADFLDAFADVESPGSLQPCYNCGRKFNPDTLERHANICKKLKQRKPFDSSKQRLEGVAPSDSHLIKKSPDPVKTKKNNWKLKHQDFLNTIRSARGVTEAIKRGEPLPPPPPAAINPDYVQCPHCSRRFNEHAAERHIKFCKEQQSRMGKSPSAQAKSRVAARTQYKPPPPGKRNSSGATIKQTPPAKQTPPPLKKLSNGKTENNKYSKYEDKPIVTKNQANKPRSANEQKKPERVRNGGSAGTTKTTAKINLSKGQYSNRYNTKDNYMETLDKDEQIHTNAFTREVRHGRRASKPGSLDDLPTEVDNLNLYDKPRHNRRNITIRDPSPTLFDDYEQSTGTRQPSRKEKSSPFPSRAQVHRPTDRNETDGHKRLSKFCYECGTKYPVEHAKFCCECGTRRP